MKLRKILALLLVAALCLMLLAACASKSNNSANSNDDQQGSAPAENSGETPPADTGNDAETGDDTGTPPPADDELDDEEVAEIVFTILDMQGYNGEHKDKIEDAVNAITVPEIGVKVELQYYGFGDYPTTVSLMITGGETLDLVNIVPVSGVYFNNLYALGQLMDISSYLSQPYAAGMMDIVGDYLGGFTFGDGIYGVPTYRIYATNQYLIMRKDILEDLGMVDAAQNARSWTEIETIFQAVKDNTDLYPLGGQKYISPTTSFYVFNDDSFDNAVVWDNLNDTLGLVFTDMDGNVSNAYANPAEKAQYAKLADLYEKGYIWPDTITNDDTSDNIVKQGVIFSKIDNSEVGVEVAKQETTGYPVVCNDIIDGMVTNSRLVSFGLGVPVTSDEPEAAVKFMSLLYTNSELMDILTWGIEGQDYVRTETGEVTYPEGVTTETCEYHNADYLLGNQFLVSPWIGNGGDFREISKQANEQAIISPYLNMALDVSELSNEIAAVNSVVDEYRPALASGLYTESTYNDFLAQLEAAGAQNYLDACQAQLDAALNG